MELHGYKLLRNLTTSLLLLSCIYSCSPSQGESGNTGNDTIKKIELGGSGYKRGLKHGKKLKDEIDEVYSLWKQNLKTEINRDADTLLNEFLKTTNFRPAIESWTPDLMDEIRGIADGSGQQYSDVFAFQLLDELWVYIDSIYQYEAEHCSSVGVPASKNHPAYLAQNMDLEIYMNGYQVLLHIPRSKDIPEQYLLTCAGLIVTTGMNEHGIGVNVNTLMELTSSTDGLPVSFVIRGMLSKRKGEDVLSFLKTVKHASGQNYLIGIQDSVYDFEASANQVVRFRPSNNREGFLYHTNHALVNHDVKRWYNGYHEKVLAGETKNMNSETRFRALEKRLEIPNDEIVVDTIRSILRSKDSDQYPICNSYRENGRVFTFGSVIYTLSGERSIQVSKGPPDQNGYKTYFFTR
jgi:predicted choloylglycine hydrolase